AEAHYGYWWLAYDWSNLLFSCRACNQEYKKNHFPVRDESKRATGPADDLKSEECLLLHPCLDHPEDHLVWNWETDKDRKMNAPPVLLIGRTERGTKTIEVLGLNRGELILERGNHVLIMEAIIDMMKYATRFGKSEMMKIYAQEIQRETSC